MKTTDTMSNTLDVVESYWVYDDEDEYDKWRDNEVN